MNYQEKDSSAILSFNPYFAGAAPVRIENLCKKISMIAYKQVLVDFFIKFPTFLSVLYFAERVDFHLYILYKI